MGSELQLSGNATSFSGVPINRAEGNYKIIRKTYHHYWVYYVGSSEVVKTGKLKTDDSGKFKIDFTAQPDEETEKENLPIQHYEIELHITDNCGESQEGKMQFNVG